MNILGIDTTTKTASCSVLTNNEYYTKALTNEITHSEKLLPIIHETLSGADLTLDDISVLAAINGPGSFTGIRIGLATIKAFAQVKEMDIYSISSIELIAYTAFAKANTNSSYVLSLIDARNNRVYFGLNKLEMVDGKVTITQVQDVQNELIEDALASLTVNPQELIIAGDCVEKFRELLETKASKLVDLYPTTEDLIDSYMNIADTSKYMYNGYTLDALYARPSQAERMAK